MTTTSMKSDKCVCVCPNNKCLSLFLHGYALLSRADGNNSEKSMSQVDHSQIKTAVFYSISAPHKDTSICCQNILICNVISILECLTIKMSSACYANSRERSVS